MAASPFYRRGLHMQFTEDGPLTPRKCQDGAHRSIDGLENQAKLIRGLPQTIAHLLPYGVSLGVLTGAIERASKLRMPVHEIIISEGFVTELTFYRSLARSLGIPFSFIPRKFQVDTECRQVLRSGIAEFVAPGGELNFMIAPCSSTLPSFIHEFASSQNSNSTKFVLTTPSNFLESVRRATSEQTINYTTSLLEQTKPIFSAASVPALRFVVIFLGTLITAIGVSLVEPDFWHLVLLALTIYPVVPSMALKLWVLGMTFLPRPPHPRPLSDHELPVYTVLVPLYNEVKIVSQLVTALLAIDYPASKLDIKILLEETDISTIKLVKTKAFRSIFDIIICPKGAPQTKPRALDMGLYFAKGDYVVVYDAEDVPDPGQLRLAAAYFAEGGSKLGCLQAKLAIENTSESWISRMFTLEYARLFDVTIPGMAAAGLPIPLGGTSNHFRREVLESIGGWDPWNVTEDADLGLRLARFGYTVADLPSSTLEEAPFELRAWFNQRMRWMKGWMQTSLVHCRYPRILIDEVGLVKASLLFLVATNTLVSSLLHPLLLISLSLMFYAIEAPDARSIEMFLMMFGLVFYNGAIGIFLLQEGAKRRRIRMRWSDFPLFLIYGLLVTAASWLALKELVLAPSFWRKTSHGLTKIPRSGGPSTNQK
jgi:cellulose synthase/poly-beta-1,6-N-acetylglucosamine synthase-like glycosyltransferase